MTLNARARKPWSCTCHQPPELPDTVLPIPVDDCLALRNSPRAAAGVGVEEAVTESLGSRLDPAVLVAEDEVGEVGIGSRWVA